MSGETTVWVVMGVYAIGAVVSGVVYDRGERAPTDPNYSIMVWLFWPIIVLAMAFGTIVFLATLLTMKVARYAASRTAAERVTRGPSGGRGAGG